MFALVGICTLLAVLMVLHTCAAHIADGEELHDLTVRVHTLRNEYLSSLRGEIIEVDEAHPVAGRIEPEVTPEAEPAQAA